MAGKRGYVFHPTVPMNNPVYSVEMISSRMER